MTAELPSTQQDLDILDDVQDEIFADADLLENAFVGHEGRPGHVGGSAPKGSSYTPQMQSVDRKVAESLYDYIRKAVDKDPATGIIPDDQSMMAAKDRLGQLNDALGYKSRTHMYDSFGNESGVAEQIESEQWPIKGPMGHLIGAMIEGKPHAFMRVGDYTVDPYLHSQGVSHDDINRFGKKMMDVYRRAAVADEDIGKASTSDILPYKSKKDWGHEFFEPQPKWSSAGTVTFNDKGEVAIVKPKGSFGGYSGYVFPKGRIDKGETPEVAAKRETLEESGHHADLLESLGEHEGTSSNTTYYLAKHTGSDPSIKDDEMEDVKWASPEEAAMLIKDVRDLRILVLAMSRMKKYFP